MPNLIYRPEIDGLRAIAVIPVILFHMNFEWIQGGFVGVDVFFVISGFLITSIIIKENKLGTFSLKMFWARRVRRILPALICMVTFTLIFCYFSLYNNEHKEIGRQGASTLLSLSNVHFWLLSRNYWGPQAENSFFIHSWSLSLEEQFYIFFPLISVFFFKWLPQHFGMILIISTIIGYSIFASIANEHPNASFYLLPFRFWELSMGCSLALTYERLNRIISNRNFFAPLLSWIGITLIIISYFIISDKDGLSWKMIIPTIGSALFIASGNKSKYNSSVILMFKPLVIIGKMSYSLYLWHWPILMIFKNYAMEQSKIFQILTIGLIGTLSFFLIEKTTRWRSSVIPFITVFFCGSLAFASLLIFSQIKYNPSAFDKIIWSGMKYDVGKNSEPSKQFEKQMMGIHVIPRPSENNNLLSHGGLIKRYGSDNPKLLLLGDSHSLMWAPVIDSIARELNASIAFCGMDGCPPVFHEKTTVKNNYDLKILEYIKKWKPIVILSARWSYWHGLNLENTVKQITSNEGEIILIQQPPELFFGDINAPQRISNMGILPKQNKCSFIPIGNESQHSRGAEKVRNLSKKFENCSHIEIADLFLNEENKAKVLLGKKVLYIDDDHLSLDGAFLAKERLQSLILNSLNRQH